MDPEPTSLHKFNTFTDFEVIHFLAQRVVRYLLNQSIDETIPHLPQLFEEAWEQCGLKEKDAAPNPDVAEQVIKTTIDRIWGHVSHSFLIKTSQFFQVPSPSSSSSPPQLPLQPSSSTKLQDRVANSHEQQTNTSTTIQMPKHTMMEIGGVTHWFMIPVMGVAAISAPVGAVVGGGMGMYSYGLLTGLGYALGSATCAPLAILGAGTTAIVGLTALLAYTPTIKRSSSSVVKILKERLENEAKAAFNMVLGELEERLVGSLVKFLKESGNENSISPSASCSDLGTSLSPGEFEDHFGELFGIAFDQVTLSRLFLNSTLETKICILSVSLDPDYTNGAYYIISTILPPSPTNPNPSLHHFRLRFSTCRNIYLSLYSLHPEHSSHYHSFPPRTVLRCYTPDFLKERARLLLDWFRLCECDDALHQSLSDELVQLKETSDPLPSLNTFSFISKDIVIHPAICNNCYRWVRGVRYKCQNCEGYNLCVTCFWELNKKTEEEAFHNPSHQFSECTQSEWEGLKFKEEEGEEEGGEKGGMGEGSSMDHEKKESDV